MPSLRTFSLVLPLLGYCLGAYAKNTLCGVASVVIGSVGIKQGARLSSGMPIYQGATVETAADAAAKIVLLDESIVDLGPSTAFRFTQCKNENQANSVDLDLAFGKVRAAINKTPPTPREKFHIRTRSSVLAVRGTELFASWEIDNSGKVAEQIGVSEGQVAVTSQFNPGATAVTLNAGQGYKAEGTATQSNGQLQVTPSIQVKPEKFTPAEQQKLEGSTKVEDKVFIASVTLPDKPSTNKEEGGRETSGLIFENVTGEKRSPAKQEKPETAAGSNTGSNEISKTPNKAPDRTVASQPASAEKAPAEETGKKPPPLADTSAKGPANPPLLPPPTAGGPGTFFPGPGGPPFFPGDPGIPGNPGSPGGNTPPGGTTPITVALEVKFNAN